MNEPDTFPPGFLQFFLESSLAVSEEGCRPVRVGMARRRFITAGALPR